MPGTNTLAYLASSSPEGKSFITLTPGGDLIKLFVVTEAAAKKARAFVRSEPPQGH